MWIDHSFPNTYFSEIIQPNIIRQLSPARDAELSISLLSICVLRLDKDPSTLFQVHGPDSLLQSRNYPLLTPFSVHKNTVITVLAK